MPIPAIERQLGIKAFASEQTCGVGGVIKQISDDFVVEEVFVDGSKAEVEPKLPENITGEGRYLICLLVKRDWDTLLAVRTIAKQLGISEQRVQIVGIKDKKALTAQYISIENIRLEKMKRVQADGFNAYPLRYSPSMIFPSMLFGNTFHVTIRGIKHNIEIIEERMSSISDELLRLGSVPNFFGHQRFGTVRPITHLVGKALAQNNIEKAALLFIAKPSPYENPKSRAARLKLHETRDFKEAFYYFPRRLLYERLMLQHLARHPEDYVGAFRRLPKRLCILFLQAYQSYLFNSFLSKRMLQKIPINEPQIGDYVVRTDRHGLPTNSYTRVTFENLEAMREAVRKKEMYVALPLIGFRQSTSEGIQGDIEKSIIKKEDITEDNFRVSPMPEMSAPGELRVATTPVMSLSIEKPTKDDLDPSKRMLRLSFTLHRGCYATVVLREFMKPRNLLKSGF